MKILRILLFFTSLIAVSSGCKEDNSVDHEYILEGYWVDPEYSGDEIIFMRSNSFISDGYGIYFKENRSLVERKNAGWCATPPVSYADFEGTWKQNGNRLLLHLSYWGGWMNVEWQIVSLNEEVLIVKVIDKDSD